MPPRYAIIPGICPEIEVHGKMPGLWRKAWPHGMSAIDLRADKDRFAEHGHDMIQKLPGWLTDKKWQIFNSVACSVPDAVVHNRLTFHAGLPIVGLGTLSWEHKAAEMARAGTLQVPAPAQHFPDRTGFLIGRSSFNYYHFITDILCFMEDLYPVSDQLDRIVINPCRDVPGGFQRQLIREIYPELADKVIFTTGGFRADQLTFVCVWPGLFRHPEVAAADTAGDTTALATRDARGVWRRALRSRATPFFQRAEAVLNTVPLGQRKDVVVISRRRANRRRLVNEDALLDALAPYNPRRIDAETLSVRDQMEICANAKVVIGTHGAGMVNTGFCREGALGIEITARQYARRALDFASLAMVRDMEYHVVIADERGDIGHMRGNRGNDVHLGPTAIRHIVDKVAAALGGSGVGSTGVGRLLRRATRILPG